MADESDTENQCILEVRKRFYDENAENLSDFDDKDLKRLKHDDLWVRCFVKARGQNVVKAVEAMNICMRWRKTFGVNELTERQIDRRLFEAGFLFIHNRDKEGNCIIIFTGKNHKKDPQKHPELKRFLVFLLEKHARMYPSKKITLVFDMQETGLANMDMDFVKFIVTCFTNYFPNTLAWLLVVELPWILSAAWKIVKTWLSPEAVNKIKFLNKADLTEYIDEDKLMERLGGKDTYEYSYPQSKEDIGLEPPERDAESLESLKPNGIEVTAINGEEKTDLSMQLSFEETDTPKPTKVKFDEENLTSNANKCALDKQDKEELPASVKPISKTQPAKQPSTSPVEEKASSTKFLNITPADDLVFGGIPNATGEVLQTLTLDNYSSSNIAFKVKTTSPESYRVRPSAGVISPSSFTDISVFLQPGHTSSVFRDKFLVLSREVSEGMTAAEVAAVWKTSPKSSILEHRLRCSIVSNTLNETNHSEATLDITNGGMKSSTLTEQLKSLERKIDRVEKKICYIEEGLQLFIKVQLGLFSGMIILFAIGFYYASFLI